MKKLIISCFSLIAAVSLNAASVSMTIPGNTMTNLLSNGPLKVTQFAVSAPTAGAVTVQAIDNTTNTLRRINPAYTNTVRWLTNYSQIYTNYYGVVTTNTWTNVLYMVTNRPVAAVTNTISPTITASAAGNSTAIFDSVNYYFTYGLWVTNTSASNATVTFTYQR